MLVSLTINIAIFLAVFAHSGTQFLCFENVTSKTEKKKTLKSILGKLRSKLKWFKKV